MSRAQQMKAPPAALVKNDTDQPAEVLASEIEKVAAAAAQLNASRLSRKAVLILLQHATGMSQRQIALVLDQAANLRTYLKR